MSAELQPLTRPALELPSNTELLDTLFDIPGSTGENYRRFHPYSPRNVGFLALQGCPPLPVATFKRWGDMGYHVKKGEKAYSILRPIQVRVKGEEETEEERRFIKRFKVVRALFHYGQVAGDGELPPYEPRDWSVDRMYAANDIERGVFESYNGNMGGYAIGRTVHINPAAPAPLRTEVHEAGHILAGHTAPEGMAEYQEHRGRMEFETEAAAFVTLKEVGLLDDATAEVMRGYVQHWTDKEKVQEAAAGVALRVAGVMITSGYEKEVSDE